MPAHEAPCTASVLPEDWVGSSLQHAMSKMYEFNPSGLTTQNKIMFVIPLFDSHHYDYDNMTLMYQEDRQSQFVDADEMKVHKPTWVFFGNKCCIFLNHFCKIYVTKRKGSGKKVKYVDVQSLLFYKQTEGILELVTTFGCYKRKSPCSTEKVTKVLNFKNIRQNFTELNL